ncbi:kinase-like domain-containing protein [Aspergillus floccosus]
MIRVSSTLSISVTSLRYQVLGKLGFGANSTTWFCRDLSDHRYVAIKVYVRSPITQARINREVDAFKHLATVRSSHIGRRFIRNVLDSFELERPDGSHHHCLVHEPLRITLYDFQRLGGALRHLLKTLDFLHMESSIAHCASNIMLTVVDESVFEDFERAEKEIMPGAIPVLCDFGEARIGANHPHECIQPEIYRAPEILLELSWSHRQLWAWDLLEQKYLFDGQDEEGYTNGYHIAEMVAYLGTPPLEFQRRSIRSPLVFTDDGNWKGDPPLPPIALEGCEAKLQGSLKVAFLRFLRSILTWVPDERKSARELLQDPWLKA